MEVLQKQAAEENKKLEKRKHEIDSELAEVNNSQITDMSILFEMPYWPLITR